MTHFSAPGKQFISGEWAILEVGNKGLVAAVNKRVHAEVEESDSISISIDDFGIKDLRADFNNSKLVFRDDISSVRDKLQFIKEAIEISLMFLDEQKIPLRAFSIRTWGEDVSVGGKKLGFGSSAASTVAVISAVLNFHAYNASKDEIYKLAAIAHYYAQGKVGSAFDVAASTYGGIFAYSRFDPQWLTHKIEKRTPLSVIVGDEWPSLVVENLDISGDFEFLIGWTGESFSTSNAIKQMNEKKKSDEVTYRALMDNVANCASRAIEAWKNDDRKMLMRCLNENELCLRNLGDWADIPIETPELRLLHEIAMRHGAAGKLSGSGGGDCGIAVCYDRKTAEKIRNDWEKSGLHPVDVGLDMEGVREEA
ncbi:MAG: phosphomevalonate kinase [Candidatus Aenigmarchaeota archaeon]|nr:phosphomevalonate kinase [Candidatus Aenigmarchaeota archaeon]